MWVIIENYRGSPGGSDREEPTCNAGDLASIPRSGRSPWRRDWLLTPVFLPGEFRRQRNLVGYRCRVRLHWVTNTHTHTHTHTHTLWVHLVIVLHLKVESLVAQGLHVSAWSTFLTSLTSSSTLLPTSPASTTNCIAWCFSKIPGMLCHRTFTLSLPLSGSLSSRTPTCLISSSASVFAQMLPFH